MFSRFTMQNQLLFFILLLHIHAVVLDSSKSKYCSPKEISDIKNKYKALVLQTVNDIEKKAENDIKLAKAKIADRLKKLQDTVEDAEERAKNEGFDIYECLDFNHINNIPKIVQNDLDACIKTFQKDVDDLLACKDDALDEINKCSLKVHQSCDDIKKCCKDVEEDFKKTVVKGFEKIEDAFKKCLKAIVNYINAEIKKIKVTVYKCSTGYDDTSTDRGHSSTKYHH